MQQEGIASATVLACRDHLAKSSTRVLKIHALLVPRANSTRRMAHEKRVNVASAPKVAGLQQKEQFHSTHAQSVWQGSSGSRVAQAAAQWRAVLVLPKIWSIRIRQGQAIVNRHPASQECLGLLRTPHHRRCVQIVPRGFTAVCAESPLLSSAARVLLAPSGEKMGKTARWVGVNHAPLGAPTHCLGRETHRHAKRAQPDIFKKSPGAHCVVRVDRVGIIRTQPRSRNQRARPAQVVTSLPLKDARAHANPAPKGVGRRLSRQRLFASANYAEEAHSVTRQGQPPRSARGCVRPGSTATMGIRSAFRVGRGRLHQKRAASSAQSAKLKKPQLASETPNVFAGQRSFARTMPSGCARHAHVLGWTVLFPAPRWPR